MPHETTAMMGLQQDLAQLQEPPQHNSSRSLQDSWTFLGYLVPLVHVAFLRSVSLQKILMPNEHKWFASAAPFSMILRLVRLHILVSHEGQNAVNRWSYLRYFFVARSLFLSAQWRWAECAEREAVLQPVARFVPSVWGWISLQHADAATFVDLWYSSRARLQTGETTAGWAPIT